jgi:hypothetical protein
VSVTTFGLVVGAALARGAPIAKLNVPINADKNAYFIRLERTPMGVLLSAARLSGHTLPLLLSSCFLLHFASTYLDAGSAEKES